METKIKPYPYHTKRSSLGFIKRFLCFLLIVNAIACRQNPKKNDVGEQAKTQISLRERPSNFIQQTTDSITQEDLNRDKIFLDFWYNMPRGKYELILRKEFNDGNLSIDKNISEKKEDYIFSVDLLIDNQVKQKHFLFVPIFENDSLRKIIIESPSSKLSKEAMSDSRGVELGRPDYTVSEFGKKEFKELLVEKYGNPEIKTTEDNCKIRSIFHTPSKVIICEEIYRKSTFYDNSKRPVIRSKGEKYLTGFTITYTSKSQISLELKKEKVEENKKLQKIKSAQNNI